MTTINRGSTAGTVVINGETKSAVYFAKGQGELVVIRSKYEAAVISEKYTDLLIDGTPVGSAGEAVERLSEFIGNFKSPGSGGDSGSGVPVASQVSASDATHSEVFGDNVQAQLNSADEAIHRLKEVASEGATPFHTNHAWEAADLAALQSWVDAAANTAHDPINDRDVSDFDVYLALDSGINYYWDTGAWLVLGAPPKIEIGILRAWSLDNASVNVRLSGVPTEEVTASSFDVYNARTGANIAILGCEGAGVDYLLTIEQQTADYGMTFIGQ